MNPMPSGVSQAELPPVIELPAQVGVQSRKRSAEEMFGTRVELEQEARCDECTKNSLSFYCLQCDVYLCGECNEQAHVMKISSSHNRLKVGYRKIFKPPFCSNHESQRLELYCKLCKEVVCLHCQHYGLHKKHEVILLAEAAETTRRSIKYQVNNAQSQAQKAENRLEEIENNIENIFSHEQVKEPSFGSKDSVATAKQRINAHFDLLIQVAEKERGKMLSNLDELQKKAAKLKKCLADFQKSLESAQEILCFSDYEVYRLPPDKRESIFECNWAQFGFDVGSEIPYSLNGGLEASLIQRNKAGAPGDPFQVCVQPCWDGCNVSWKAPGRSSEHQTLEYYKVKIFSEENNEHSDKKLRTATKQAKLKISIELISKDLLPSPSVLVNCKHLEGCEVVAAVMAVDLNGGCSSWVYSPKVKLENSFFLSGSTIALRNHRGFMLSAEPDGSVSWRETTIGNQEKFDVMNVGVDKFVFRGHHGNFLSAGRDGIKVETLQGTETWTVKNEGGGVGVTIKSQQGWFLSVSPNGKSGTRRRAAGWEHFHIEKC